MEPHYVRARALEELGQVAAAVEDYEWLAGHPRAPGDVPERLSRARAKRDIVPGHSPLGPLPPSR